jgi:predicted O-methyltransferase YrrM
VLEEWKKQTEERNRVGRVLYQYARLINAKKVFELGSAIGCSTLWWAQAVGEMVRSTTPMAIPRTPKKLADTLNARGRRPTLGKRY